MASAAVSSTSNQARPDFKVASFPVSPADSRKHHVKTALNYYKPAADGSPPKPSINGKPETYYCESETLEVTIHDISGNELDYTLYKNGFQFYYHESKQKLFVDEDEIKNEYYPETEQLLKDATGASKIFIFDHTIRRPENAANQTALPGGLRSPVQRVHIDQSYQASANRVTYHLPAEAETLLRGRYQIINVWRPIKTIYKDPLAVADAHSVPDSDLVPVKLIYPNREGETYTVKPNKEHKWYYRYGQTPDIVTLIKCFDSKLDGRARRVPHTAFVNPETATAEYPARESIEIRALVFHPDDSE